MRQRYTGQREALTSPACAPSLSTRHGHRRIRGDHASAFHRALRNDRVQPDDCLAPDARLLDHRGSANGVDPGNGRGRRRACPGHGRGTAADPHDIKVKVANGRRRGMTPRPSPAGPRADDRSSSIHVHLHARRQPRRARHENMDRNTTGGGAMKTRHRLPLAKRNPEAASSPSSSPPCGWCCSASPPSRSTSATATRASSASKPQPTPRSARACRRSSPATRRPRPDRGDGDRDANGYPSGQVTVTPSGNLFQVDITATPPSFFLGLFGSSDPFPPGRPRSARRRRRQRPPPLRERRLRERPLRRVLQRLRALQPERRRAEQRPTSTPAGTS